MPHQRTGRSAVTFFLLVSLLFIALEPAFSSAAASNVTPSQADYLSALSAADHLLQAWQSSDAENGMSLLTSHAKKAASTELIERFFSNDGPSAYEIERPKMLARGRYAFPIVLMTLRKNRVHRQFSNIIVLNTGGNDWAVDKLP
jgi:hypothetical protein